MPSTLKRPLSSSSPSVSPPETKRNKRAFALSSQETLAADESSIRIFSWNVNGVNALLQKSLSFSPQTGFPLRRFLKRHRWPHFLCLQEVKISHRDEVTQRRLQHAANAGSELEEPTYHIHFSLPRDIYNATGFGGKVHGVATLVRDDFRVHVRATERPDWDLEGRVLIHQLYNNMVVVNGYWVNGTDKPYRNTESGTVEGTRHDHKLRFHRHMLDKALSLEQDGKHVILIGDMNVARSRIDAYPDLRTSPDQHVKNRLDFNQKFFDDPNGLKAVDVFRQLHGLGKKYTYFPRGCGWGESCDRVDLIMTTQRLFASGAITCTDICDNPDDRGHSDHVPLWVELDRDLLSKGSAAQESAIEAAPTREGPL